VRLSKTLTRAVERLVDARSFQVFSSDVEQDFEIWKHKEFVPKPALAMGDGPVMRYRRWAEQFYEDQSGSGALDAVAER
jgi:cholesterol 7-desaturase